ncbi:amino acid/polyamine/organocation transporter, APC superfamily [Paenibacillaceae bacterium GAS479]|nr:amino acid/polyamine/organocation transporter, APC superfamily [Paenibacillaceae bacterium GAS479]
MRGSSGNLPWWQLSLFGAGCTIGTAFFLGSGIAVRKSGWLVLPLFLLVAVSTYIVYDALARMTARNPDKGSFRTYAQQAFGRWAGFGTGWIYWFSELLILGGTLTALGLFTQVWLPGVPLWVFAAGYAVLALLVVVLGSSGINKAENLFAIVKIAAVLMFIAVVAFLLLRGTAIPDEAPSGIAEAAAPGWLGAWKGLLYAFYAFSGIEVMGFMAAGLRKPEEAPKAGAIMLMLITVLYIGSIGLAMLLVPAAEIKPEISPFILVLEQLRLNVLVHVLNGVLIVAGFSILVASLYGVSTMLVTLAEEGDAPVWTGKTMGRKKLPLPALLVNAGGMAISVILALLMPRSLFEHLATAGGIVLLYVWMMITLSYLKLERPGVWGQVKAWGAILLMGAAVAGALAEPSGRPGFWVSLAIAAVVAAVTAFMSRRWKAAKPQLAGVVTKSSSSGKGRQGGGAV